MGCLWVHSDNFLFSVSGLDEFIAMKTNESIICYNRKKLNK